MSTSRNQTAKTLTSVYGNRSFKNSTITSMVKANVLHSAPQGGVDENSLRRFIANTRAEDYSTYPDPDGGLLRVSVLHKRESLSLQRHHDPRIQRMFKGVDINDHTQAPSTFLKGFEGIWGVSEKGADLAVQSGTHLLASLRGYTHPSMVRKIVDWSIAIDGYRWFHTVPADPAVSAWIGSGVILPADDRRGVWGWAISPALAAV